MSSADVFTVAPHKPAAPSSLPPILRSFERWTVGFFLFSFVFHVFCRLVLHMRGHMVYPLSMNTHDRFYDFTIFTDKFKLFHTAEFFHVGFAINYPAPVALVFELFFKFAAPHSLFAFVTFSTLAFLIPAALFARSLTRRGIGSGAAWLFMAITCLLSWPVLLIVDGGNAEVIVWIALAIAMWAYATGREWLAAIFFGVGASIKLFPFVFLALFLSRRHFTKLLVGAAVFFAISIISLAILGPTIPIAYNGILFGLTSFKLGYMAFWRPGENGVDHSLFCLIKYILVFCFHHSQSDFTGWLQAYSLATAIGGILLYFLRIRFMPLLNQVLTLSISCIYFTAFSGDGTLIHLYYALAMLFLLTIQAARDRVTIPGLATIMYSMVFCVSVESFFVVNTFPGGLRYIGPMHCIGLTVMLIAALRYPLGPPLADQLGETVLSEPVTAWATQSASTPPPVSHAQ